MKNKTQKSIISTLLVLVLVVGCFAALPLMTSAAPAPVPGNPSPKMDWNPAYIERAATITPYDYDRGNAAGDKISSNAHSADYPGIYFYWNDKQREDGVLLVDPSVFDLFEGGTFTVTAKTSNCYWGHVLSVNDDFAYDTDSGLYIYNVFKNCMYTDKKGNLLKDDMKNINMVFIDGNYKDAYVRPVKIWLNENGDAMENPGLDVTFKDNFVINEYKAIKISTFSEAVNGKKVTVTENAISGYKTLQNPVTVTVKADERKDAVFTNQKLYAKITIVKVWELLSDSVAPGAVFNIYDLDDNLVCGPVGPGTYQVKAGTYKVVEESIPGFTLVTANNVGVTVAAGETKTVEFQNQETRGKIIIQKNVAGMPIIQWLIENVDDEVARNDILNGIVFRLYKEGAGLIDRRNAKNFDAIGVFENGEIVFTPGPGKALGELQGYYWVDEELINEAASRVFDPIDMVRVFIGKNGVAGFIVDGFDLDAKYTIVNGYNWPGYRNLGYPGLNNNGDLFYIGVTNTNNGKVFDSYCAYAGSKNFAGDNHLGCTGYLVAGSSLDAKYLSAFNYIEDKYGNLNENRAITQTVIWALLGAVDVNSDAFDATSLTAAEKAAVRDVMANFYGYVGEGKIVDAVYMLCENPEHTFEFCQPQIVPLYGEPAIIDNPLKTFNRYEFRIVTSTEKANIATNSNNLGTEVKEDHPLGSGIDVKDVWNDALITGDPDADLSDLLAKMQVIVENADAGKLTWTWNINAGEITAGNKDGDIWSSFAERSFYVGNTILNDAAWIYFGADDAVIVKINGEIVAWSYNVLGFDKENLAIQYPLGPFQANLDRPGFTLYSANLAVYLNTNAVNTIEILALNQAVPPEAPLSDVISEKNPCGILLAFEVFSYDGEDLLW